MADVKTMTPGEDDAEPPKGPWRIGEAASGDAASEQGEGRK